MSLKPPVEPRPFLRAVLWKIFSQIQDFLAIQRISFDIFDIANPHFVSKSLLINPSLLWPYLKDSYENDSLKLVFFREFHKVLTKFNKIKTKFYM